MKNILLDEQVYVMVAPDGVPQSASVSETYEECIAIMEVFASRGLSKPVATLFTEGYQIVKAHLTFIQIATAEETFDEAKTKIV